MDNWIICFADGGVRKYYDMEALHELGIDQVFYYLQDMYFQLNPKKIFDWNTFLNEEWTGLDDAYYYSHRPIIEKAEEMEFSNKWLIYEDQGLFHLDEYIELLENRIYSIKKVKDILNNL